MNDKVSTGASVALLTLSALFWSSVVPAPKAFAQAGPGAKPERPGRQRKPAGSAGSERRQPVVQRAGRELEQAEPVSVLPARAKRWAVIVGVDVYEDGGISGLFGASNDATSLRDALVEYAGFPGDQVILLASDQPPAQQPRRTNILRALSHLRGAVPRDGLLLVAFAGHRIERSGRAYLLPSDAVLEGDVNMLEETAVNVERMKTAIRATGVRQVILFIDACRNDPEAGRGVGGNPLTPEFARSFDFDLRNREVDAFVVFYATAVGQRAYEYKVKKQGYFTWAIVDGLSGEAADVRGEVTLASLVDYVQETVPRYVHRDLGMDKRQTPYMDGGGYKSNKLVLAVSKRPPSQGGEVSARPGLAPETTPASPPTTKGDNAVASASAPSGGAAASDPGKARTHFEAARAEEAIWNYSGAETDYRKAVSLAPEKALYHHALGKFLQEKQSRASSVQTGPPGLLAADYEAQQEENRRKSRELDCYRRRAELQRVQANQARMDRRAGRIGMIPPPPAYEILCSQPTWERPAPTYRPPVPSVAPLPSAPGQAGPELGPTLTTQDPLLNFKTTGLGLRTEILSELALAARLEPENAAYHFDYGSALTWNRNGLNYFSVPGDGDDVKAEEEFRAAVRLEPGNAKYQAALGSILGSLNKWAEAVVAYRAAVLLDPKNKEYKTALKNAQRQAK